MHIGKRIKQLIETEGLSITEVAQTIEKTRQTVYDLFTKQHVSTEILERLSLRYAVPIAYFFDEYFPLPQNITQSPKNNPQLGDVNINRHIQDKLMEDQPSQARERETDLNKIIYLQEKLLGYEHARQCFIIFLDKLRESIILQKKYKKRLSPQEEKEQLDGTSFSEVFQISQQDNQKTYEEIFQLYDDFEVFFASGFITDVYWKRAWSNYLQAK